MCHRVRAGLADHEFRKLMGIVEVDETYVGGKNKNRHGTSARPEPAAPARKSLSARSSGRVTLSRA